MSWQERVIAAHLAVTDRVSHAARLKSERYFVWTEDGAEDFEANGRHVERGMQGITDLFTKREFDPWGEALGPQLSAQGIAWRLDSVDFEPEAGFWHWQWHWGVRYGPD